ncbi:TIGR03089 family protein [Micromonospora sp. NPDC047074]|uniref:TIGR03089 family protein n=1 Tax=Micromonospora sp. NPDC047074 TaxID=3154339 RepID=UPI0033E9C852
MDITAAAMLPAQLASRVTDTALFTYYDDQSGERTELSVAQLGGWAARTMRLLQQGCGLGTGSRVAILLPPHWQTAAVFLGAWAAGMATTFHPVPGLPATSSGGRETFDATFVSAKRVGDWLEDKPEARHQFVLGLTADAFAGSGDPTGYRDYLTEAGRYPDSMPSPSDLAANGPALVDDSPYEEWDRLTQSIVESLGLRPGDRLLIDAAKHEHPVWWLLAPLAVGASVVLCANLDPALIAERSSAERVTRIL